MSCTSCYNGCVDVTSDECVRYTGLSIPALGITTGDTLKYVEQMITNKLVPLLTGTGDAITIAPADTCALITQFLIGITNPNSKQLFTALTKAACSLQTQVTAVKASIDTLNANYVISCLSGVTVSSDTHEIVQAIITKLCETVVALAALSVDVNANYVKISEIDNLYDSNEDSFVNNGERKSYVQNYVQVGQGIKILGVTKTQDEIGNYLFEDSLTLIRAHEQEKIDVNTTSYFIPLAIIDTDKKDFTILH